ncbi:PQQ-binding-like beta-propeller repeat protein [bacterium]|nr:PQQ-binding-like beta-propeller repeat protein [bacterium]
MRKYTSRFASVTFVALMVISSLKGSQESDTNWPGWGGPNRDFTVAPGVIEPNQRFELKVGWKKKLGSGYSAVSVQGNRAVTMYADDTFDYVIALDVNDGSEFWRFKIDTLWPGRFGSANGSISTPLLTKDKVIALSGAGRLFALDLGSGEMVWETHLVNDHYGILPFYGFTTSPLILDNILLVQTGGTKENAISAFDPKTGDVLWTASSDTVQFQSPSLLTTRDGTQFVGITDRALYGLQPGTGKILWRFEHGGTAHPMGAPSGNLVPVRDNRFFFKNTGRGSVFLSVEYSSEMYQVKEVWSTSAIKASYIVPVYYDGHIFGYNSRIFTCVDAGTGKRVWRSREPGDGFPILVDGHLFVITKKGTLSAAPASPEGFNEITSLDLFEDLVWAPASFAQGRLFLRSMSEIAAVDIVSTTAKQVAVESTAGQIPGSRFAKFVEKVEAAEDKEALVDAFMSEQKTFPIIEGDNLVHFIYRGEANDVALLGDLVGWRYDWPMHRVKGTDLFYYSCYLEPDAGLTYKFMKDLQTPVVDSLNTRSVRTMFFGPASWFSMPKWPAPDYLEPFTDSRTGRIDSLEFQSSDGAITRTLEVYLPHGYDASDEAYPVAYIHAGQSARTLGQMTTSLDNLIGKRIKPIIVVFLPSFFKDPTGGYMEYIGDYRDRYTQMLVEEVVPLVDRSYRTQPNAENRANIGHLINGYMALHSTFKHPDVFGKVSIQSIWWDGKEQQRQRDLITSSKNAHLQIYFDWGKYDLKSPLESVDVVEGGRAVARLLREGGYSFSGGEINAGTGWGSWKNRTHRVFETFFPLSLSGK